MNYTYRVYETQRNQIWRKTTDKLVTNVNKRKRLMRLNNSAAR